MTAATAPGAPRRTARPAVTARGAAWAAVLLAALALRLVGLGGPPLDPMEAAAALPAWAGGAPVAPPLLHGLLATLGRAAAPALGADLAARLPSALAGVAAVAACRGLARLLGAKAALAAAAVVALDPLSVDAARHVDAAPLGLALVLGAAAAALAGRGVAAALALGLAATAGPLGLSGALAGLAAAAAWRGRAIVGIVAGAPARAVALGLAGLLGATAGATALGVDPGGLLGLAWASPAAWRTAWAPEAAGEVLGFVAVLAVYAPFTLAFGAVGLARLARPTGRGGAPGAALALGTWLAAAVALGLWTGAPGAARVAAAPLALGAGVAVVDLAAALRRGGAWSEEGALGALVLVALAAALVRLAFFAERGPAGVVDPADSMMLAAGAAGVALAVLAGGALVWGPAAAGRAAAWSLGLALAAVSVAGGRALLAGGPTELARPLRAAVGVRFLAAAALRAAGPGGAVAIASGVDPSAAWALRATGARLDEGAPVRVEAAPEGVGWRVVTRWRPAFEDAQRGLRWLLQRRGGGATDSGSVESTWAALTVVAP